MQGSSPDPRRSAPRSSRRSAPPRCWRPGSPGRAAASPRRAADGRGSVPRCAALSAGNRTVDVRRAARSRYPRQRACGVRRARSPGRGRVRAIQRLEKVIQDAGIKLTSVASQTYSKSARAMLEALLSGVTEPELLAELAKARMRSKIPQLREALANRFDVVGA